MAQQAPATHRVLLVGATGRTGRHALRLLLQRDEPTRVMSRDAQRAKSTLEKDIPADKQHLVDFVQGDVSDRASLRQAVRGVDGIINVGGPTQNFFGSNTSYHVDYLGVQNLLEALKEEGVAPDRFRKFVYTSSVGVSGGFRAFALNLSLGNYAKWKLAAENLLRASAYSYICLRPGMLNEEPSKGSFLIRQDDSVGFTATSREDVALLAVTAFCDSAIKNVTLDFCNGPDKDLAEQLRKLQPDAALPKKR
jgi:uncharacterized protein YbjT (DUF2867 family)